MSSKKMDCHRTSTWKLALNVAMSATKQKTAFHLSRGPDTARAGQQDTGGGGGLIIPSCHVRVCHSPQIPTPQESLSDHLGLAADYCLSTSIPNAPEDTWDSGLGSWKAV